MRDVGVASTNPCTRLADYNPALWAAGSALLRGKGEALLAAGKAQLTERRPWVFKPQADPTSLACFAPLSSLQGSSEQLSGGRQQQGLAVPAL